MIDEAVLLLILIALYIAITAKKYYYYYIAAIKVKIFLLLLKKKKKNMFSGIIYRNDRHKTIDRPINLDVSIDNGKLRFYFRHSIAVQSIRKVSAGRITLPYIITS